MAFILTNTPREFIPESQKDQDSPLTFICVPPSRKTVLDLQELILRSVNTDEDLQTMDLPISTMMDLYLDACIIDWKNMTDSDGKAIAFTKEEFATFNDMQILLELYTYVKELSEGN